QPCPTERSTVDRLARRLFHSRFSRSPREISQSYFPRQLPSCPSRLCIDPPAQAGRPESVSYIRVRPKASASELRKSPDPQHALPSKAIQRRLRACSGLQHLNRDNARAPIRSPGYATNCRQADTRHTAHKSPPLGDSRCSPKRIRRGSSSRPARKVLFTVSPMRYFPGGRISFSIFGGGFVTLVRSSLGDGSSAFSASLYSRRIRSLISLLSLAKSSAVIMPSWISCSFQHLSGSNFSRSRNFCSFR